VARFKQDMSAHVHEPQIKRNQKSGFESGVQGIPTLFINGLYYDGAMRLANLLLALTSG
jgi:protein-disulfide isomerase